MHLVDVNEHVMDCVLAHAALAAVDSPHVVPPSREMYIPPLSSAAAILLLLKIATLAHCLLGDVLNVAQLVPLL